MSNYQENLSDRILEDYHKVEMIIQEKLGIPICEWTEMDLIKDFHKSLYIYKELLSEITLAEDPKSYFLESLNGLMEFLWVILCGKYRLSSMTLRGSMETYAKGLLIHLIGRSTDKFSNNIESSFKNIVDQISTSQGLNRNKKDSLKKLMNQKFADKVKQEYWDLSDVVHSRETMFNACSEYIDDILSIVKEEELLILMMNKVNKILKYFIEILVISNYEDLDNNMNYFIFKDIKNRLSDEFKEVNNIFI
ncbi:hypothetical protein [Bacillus sp. BPN334]|uniref:hypothetical protein n=1 Tax=Bacillus sp. BPN334 TaxID=2217815 RepID=UPI0011EC4561|nr:hypothetical protein [Bacillus sp. BPN334]KAA0784605.1 hypothetical protein DN393_21405 [Bacillus sp. BPN334]